MIDLTPLDVRKKREDIPKVLRGYDPEEVDTFLEIVAERFEELVKENLTLKERSERLAEQVEALESREKAVHEALVTAQELSSEIGDQARREAQMLRRQTEAEIRRVQKDVETQIGDTLREADRLLTERKQLLRDLEQLRIRYLRSLRGLLEKELDAVTAQEARESLELDGLGLDLTDWRERLRELGTGVELSVLDPDLSPAPSSVVESQREEAPETTPVEEARAPLAEPSLGLEEASASEDDGRGGVEPPAPQARELGAEEPRSG